MCGSGLAGTRTETSRSPDMSALAVRTLSARILDVALVVAIFTAFT
ncbi:MAG: hypothetical protein ACKN9P_04440 [Phenylobacterium sp.]